MPVVLSGDAVVGIVRPAGDVTTVVEYVPPHDAGAEIVVFTGMETDELWGTGPTGGVNVIAIGFVTVKLIVPVELF